MLRHNIYHCAMSFIFVYVYDGLSESLVKFHEYGVRYDVSNVRSVKVVVISQIFMPTSCYNKVFDSLLSLILQFRMKLKFYLTHYAFCLCLFVVVLLLSFRVKWI